jgi:hypothetical protein
MLEHETVDADGVLTRVPLPFAYAQAWARVLDYHLVAMEPRSAFYAPAQATRAKKYYVPQIDAGTTYLKVRTPVSTFAVYFHEEPVRGGMSCALGMWGEALPEDGLEQMMLAVRHLPYSAQVIEKLIEKSDWLDANPMYRGLPGVAGRKETPGQSADEEPAARPLDW